MQRPARSTPFRSCVPLAVALLAGCVTVEDQPELTAAESACGDCVAPPVVDWVRGAADPDELFPRDVRHLHVHLMRGDGRSFFALGTGGGDALWLYRVQMADQSNLLGAIAGAAAAHHDAGLTAFFSVVGGFHGPPPPPQDPGGEPPIPTEVVGIVVDSGASHEEIVKQTFDQLGQ